MQSEQVNFNRPDKADSLGSLHPSEWEFTALDTWMEYRADQFTALKASVETKAVESVTIKTNGGTTIGTYKVTKVMAVWDGQTFKAQLRKI